MLMRRCYFLLFVIALNRLLTYGWVASPWQPVEDGRRTMGKFTSNMDIRLDGVLTGFKIGRNHSSNTRAVDILDSHRGTGS